MTLVNDVITLGVAEQASSLHDIWALMRISKATHVLLCSYEHSLVRGRMANRSVYSAHQIDFLPCSGSVLSSTEPARRILKPFSFAVLKELDLRAQRVAALLAPGGILARKAREGVFAELDGTATEKLMARFTKACAILDHLADCEVEVAALDRPGHSPLAHYHAIFRDLRRTQLEALGALSAEGLAVLIQLVTVAGMAYAEVVKRLPFDPDGWERILAFKETVLRRGTMALWALLSEPEKHESHRFFRSATDEVLREIWAWERGMSGEEEAHGEHSYAALLPGLHMTMLTEFERKVGKKASEALDDVILRLVKPPKEKPGQSEEMKDGSGRRYWSIKKWVAGRAGTAFSDEKIVASILS